MRIRRLPAVALLTFGLVAFNGQFISRAVAADKAGVTRSLFDGKTLNGWTIENDCKVKVQDGMLLLAEGNGWLRSNNTYRDFKFHVEWKALKKSKYDAGIYIRTLPGTKPFPRKSYQANLLQGKEGNIGNLKGASSKGLIKPAGEWNTFDITVIGETVEMVINGQKAYKVGGIKIPAGYIGIQVEVPGGGQFLVRNVKVTELGFTSLFNGKDFTNWEGAGKPASDCWAVQNGELVGLRKRGPWLRSKKEYGDFNLRLEYLVEPGANSGVYIRVPKNGNHHRDNAKLPPAGFEVQILDDHARKYRKLKPYQYCGSIYDIAGATKHVCKPAGQWNTLELNCDGYHITSIHNGVVIVDADAKKNPKIKLRQLRGYLGLQNHGGGVRFRNIRIGPATKNLTLPQ
ncbi:MAG: DUF1080 domain-containing protein [Planctomycetaceae bacterium]